MAGISIEWNSLEHAFENHAPDVRAYLDRNTGEVLVISDGDDNDPALLRVQSRPERFLFVEPVPSREQYRMMEQFIETVINAVLGDQLRDAIVGKGAFRRFKDAVGRHPDERKRWFAFRDVLLHRYILEWLQTQRISLTAMPDWSLELPEPEATPSEPTSAIEPPVETERQELRELKTYLQSWVRAHGDEYRYLFGPAAFDRLAEDMLHEFVLARRR